MTPLRRLPPGGTHSVRLAQRARRWSMTDLTPTRSASHIWTALSVTPSKLAGRDSHHLPKCRRELALIAEAKALGNLEHR